MRNHLLLLNYLALLLYFLCEILRLASGTSLSPCGQISNNPVGLGEKNSDINVPWTAQISRTDGITTALRVAAVIVSPSIVLALASKLETDHLLQIYPFTNYFVTLGSIWGGDGDVKKSGLLISHISIHPKYVQSYWTNERNNEILFHLQHPLNISETVQPICLPEAEDEFKQLETDGSDPVNKSIIMTGWNRNYAQEIYLKMFIEPRKECERRWTLVPIQDLYIKRFCATVVGGNSDNRCIQRGAVPAKLVNGAYYIAGHFNNFFSTNRTGICHPNATLYYFHSLRMETVNWIRSNIECGSSNFTCGTGECIPLDKLCNRLTDCADGSDESKPFCNRLYKCKEDEFYCTSNIDGLCIPRSKVNDGEEDCYGGEDESEYIPQPDSAFGPVIGAISVVIVITVFVAILSGYAYFKYKTHSPVGIDNLPFTTSWNAGSGQPMRSSSHNHSSSSNVSYTKTNPKASPWQTKPWLENLGELGEGGFGKVYRAKDLSDIHNPAGFAIKCIDIRKTLGPRPNIVALEKNLMKEIDILKQLNCDNIVRYYACWAEAEDGGYVQLTKSTLTKFVECQLPNTSFSSTQEWTPVSFVYIQLEYCDSALDKWVKSVRLENKMGVENVIGIASDVLRGLNYVHTKGFIHRDLKPENILCTVGPTNNYTWKIGDFGLAIENSGDGCLGIVGTRSYQSPEMSGGCIYSSKTDVYSLGILFLEMIQESKVPLKAFAISQDILKLQNDDGKLEYIMDLTEGKHRTMANVIIQMIRRDPNERVCCQNASNLLNNGNSAQISNIQLA